MPYSLSGDLGGTKCFLAIHDLDALKDDARVAPLLENELLCKDYQSMGELINDFLKRWNGETPVVGCIGVAGPVADGRVCITNLDWHESVEELQNATGVGKIKLINDFTATGYGLLAIRPDDYLDFDVRNGTVSTPTVVPDNSTGIVSFAGAGTGFGVGFIANGLAYSAEGGHTTFSPIEAEDHALAKFIREKYDTDHVSFERIVSGLGLRGAWQGLRFESTSSPRTMTLIWLFLPSVQKRETSMLLRSSRSSSITMASTLATCASSSGPRTTSLPVGFWPKTSISFVDPAVRSSAAGCIVRGECPTYLAGYHSMS